MQSWRVSAGASERACLEGGGGAGLIVCDCHREKESDTASKRESEWVCVRERKIENVFV